MVAAGLGMLGLVSPSLGESPSGSQAEAPSIMYRLPPTRSSKTESDWMPTSVIIPPKLIAANSRIDVPAKLVGETKHPFVTDDRTIDLNRQLDEASDDFEAELEREFMEPQPPAPIFYDVVELSKPTIREASPLAEIETPLVDESAPSSEAIPFAPTVTELSERLLPSIRQAYALGQRGALFAAKAEFTAVLRRVATAKDVQEQTDRYSRALSDGLRALDEAEDLMPGGTQLTDMDLAVVTSSHRTPVLNETEGVVLPHQAAALYYAYAESQLGEAVAGEQAGSMALHGLGKVYSRESEQDPNNQQVIRNSMTMYQAALLAHPQNHLAANELGVLLARNGHNEKAAEMFERVIELSPNATAYHNLAVVQQKVGLASLATANEQRSQGYARWESANGAVSRRKGIQWVSPDQFALAGGSESPAPAAQMQPTPAAGRPMVTPGTQYAEPRVANANGAPGYRGQPMMAREEEPSAWQKMVNVAKFGRTRTASNDATPTMQSPRNSPYQAHGYSSAGTVVR